MGEGVGRPNDGVWPNEGAGLLGAPNAGARLAATITGVLPGAEFGSMARGADTSAADDDAFASIAGGGDASRKCFAI